MKTILTAFLSLAACITVNAQQVISIADSNNLFAFKLYDEVKKENKENLFFSPFSISTALAMTYAGARSETEKQMCRTLHFSPAELRDTFHREYKSYLEKIESDTCKDLTMETGNSLWIANTFKLLPSFSEIVDSDYKSEAKNVDFSKSERTRQEINRWVEQKTNAQIKELIKPHILDANTRLVLVNAIYFKGKWSVPFSKDSTKNEDFYKNSSDTVKADFMHYTRLYKYYEDGFLKSVEIPYSGGKTSMMIFLPKVKDGINDMESKIDYSYYSKIVSSMRSQKVQLAIPKFKSSVAFELSKTLSAMGMPDAFSGLADFSGMSDESLQISAVVHKAFIDVNEEGTEAAAATAVVARFTSAGPMHKNIPVFIANHPFIFVIRDNAAGSILFMGKISNPEN